MVVTMKRPKSFSKGPNKTVLKELGGTGLKRMPKQPDFGGNDPVGFIQNTQPMATAAMKGRAPPPLIGGNVKGPARADAKKQFKPKGRKVF